jgi:glycosyltransferase involved in cell wall biosynthesis
MHIAFLTSEYVTEPDFNGGLANYVHRAGLGLLARGHRIEVFVPASRSETFEHRGIMVHRVFGRSRWLARLSAVTRYRFAWQARMLEESWYLAMALRQAHRRDPFDVAQATSFRCVGLCPGILCRVPLVVRASSYDPYWLRADQVRVLAPQRLQQWLERLGIQVCQAAYAPSRLVADAWAARLRRRVSVMEPPFFFDSAPAAWRPPPAGLRGSQYVLFVGNMRRLKGADTLAEAMARVMPRHPEMRFLLAGSDLGIDGRPAMDYVRDRLKDCLDRVHYLGILEHADLYPLVAGARVVALPSRMDNLPNACLEAMALGKVVVATRGASFDQLIEDGASGFLTPAGDAEALAEAIERAWRLDDDRRDAIGRAAAARISQMRPDLACARLEAFLRRAARSGR